MKEKAEMMTDGDRTLEVVEMINGLAEITETVKEIEKIGEMINIGKFNNFFSEFVFFNLLFFQAR